jgi:hypothetical protein
MNGAREGYSFESRIHCGQMLNVNAHATGTKEILPDTEPATGVHIVDGLVSEFKRALDNCGDQPHYV